VYDDLIASQISFMTYATGGASGKQYTGKSMHRAHARLISEKGLNTTHFDMVAVHLVAALQNAAVPQTLIDETMSRIAPLRPIFDPSYNPEEAAAQSNLSQEPSAQVAGLSAAVARTTLGSGAAEEKPSLAERLGGEAALVAAVDLFYAKLTVDPELKRFFDKIPIKLLKEKQVGLASRTWKAG
jgi:truncated hemoglobin YjbI